MANLTTCKVCKVQVPLGVPPPLRRCLPNGDCSPPPSACGVGKRVLLEVSVPGRTRKRKPFVYGKMGWYHRCWDWNISVDLRTLNVTLRTRRPVALTAKRVALRQKLRCLPTRRLSMVPGPGRRSRGWPAYSETCRHRTPMLARS